MKKATSNKLKEMVMGDMPKKKPTAQEKFYASTGKKTKKASKSKKGC